MVALPGGKYGYSDSQIRPYTFSLAPFLADQTLIQEGYLGSEPFLIEQQAHFKPVVLPLADAGYLGYDNIIATSTKLVATNPDLVQRFVDASIEGWYSYLYGDPSPADALIRKANPDMPQDLINYGRHVLIQYGVVDSGDTQKLGIGAMTAPRWSAFYQSMAAVGVLPERTGHRAGVHAAFCRSSRRHGDETLSGRSARPWKGLDTGRMPVFIGYDQAERMLAALLDRAAQWQPDVVVGISRGGLVPASMAAGLLALPLAMLACDRRTLVAEWLGPPPDGRRVLLIDDCCATGEPWPQRSRSCVTKDAKY